MSDNQIRLTPEQVQALDLLAELQGCDRALALQRAIATELYIKQAIKQGATILVQKADGDIREMLFR